MVNEFLTRKELLEENLRTLNELSVQFKSQAKKGDEKAVNSLLKIMKVQQETTNELETIGNESEGSIAKYKQKQQDRNE